MNFNNLLDLYSLNSSTVLFKHVKSNELIPLATGIEKFKNETHDRYDNDEHLNEIYNFLRKIFFKFTTSFLPYNKVIRKELEQQLLTKFHQVKNSYPELFSNVVIHIAKSFRQVIACENNYLSDFLCEYINNKSEAGLKVAIVTKRAISIDEKLLISNKLKSFLKINYYTENSFRKEINTFDDVIYVGSPNYFGDYVKNTFKGKNITFISYDIFSNSLKPKRIFEDIDKRDVVSTIFEHVSFSTSIEKKENIILEQEQSLETFINKIIKEQQINESNTQEDVVEACIIYLENERFLFAPRDSKIRIFTPHEKSNSIKQINFKDVEEDDYIIIRNERDTKLIAEVADQDILKSKAKEYRLLQNKWKKRLRFNVKKKGWKKVSYILMKKYHLKTASIASLRSWCNEESICPTELPKLLKALKYNEEDIKVIYSTMKKIQLAHRQAGRIISEKLMNELSSDIFRELQEKGFYTFMSSEFDGASFNIERIVSISKSKHLIAPYNLMKPMDID